MATYTLAALIILWATAGEFAAAFMCHVPNTWDWPNGRCSDRVLLIRLILFGTFLTDKHSGRLLELLRDHKHAHRYRAHCLTADHDLNGTNVNRQEGIWLFILCLSYHVSRHVLAGNFVLIRRQSHRSLCVQACLLEQESKPDRS